MPTTDDSSPPAPAPVIHQVYKDTAETLNAKAVKEYEEAGGDAAHADADADDDEKGAEELGLPLARVKRIMKLDKEVKNMQVDASKCVAKCTELFIEFGQRYVA